MVRQTLGAALSHMLKDRGVDTVFGIPGVHNVELYRGIEEAGITHILARHEQGAGFMADGYARATGKPGVAFVISGPGLTNIMTPMGQAYSDSVPLLVISSCLPDGPAVPGRLHEMLDQEGAAATVCDWSITATDAGHAYALADRAFEEFKTQRARPKHIQIPIDILSEIVTEPFPEPPAYSAPVSDLDDIVQIADRLKAAVMPMFIFGGGASGCADLARKVLNRFRAASFTTYAGRGVVNADNALAFGSYLARPESAAIIGKSDCVVAIGATLAEVDLWRDDLGHAKTNDGKNVLIRVDRDRDVLIDWHGAGTQVCADAGDFLSGLLDLTVGHKATSKWQPNKAAETRAGWRAAADAERPGIVPLCDAMRDLLPKNAMIYSDMTQFAYVAKEVWDMDVPGHWHHPYGFGTLGFAVPAAIGGKVALPGTPVIAIAGDSGFQYNVQELGAAMEMGLTLPIILWDNEKLKEIEDCMVAAQIAPNAVVAKNPDFGKLAAAYGLAYEKPGTVAAFKNALITALNADRPTILHVTPLTASGD